MGTDIRVTIELRAARSTGEWLIPYLSILLVFALCTWVSSSLQIIGAKPLSELVQETGLEFTTVQNTADAMYDSNSLHPDQARFQSGYDVQQRRTAFAPGERESKAGDQWRTEVSKVYADDSEVASLLR